MYTIGQIAKMMNLSVPTLRYYDDEGILINIKRDNAGNRIFDDSDIEALKIINCLKKSGLKIKEIKEFMDLCRQGNSSLQKRYDFFLNQEQKVLDEIQNLEICLALIKYKEWYYQTALLHNDEGYVKNLDKDTLPKEIKEYLNKSKIKEKNN